MAEGKIVAGILAPHPPHLVYAENPPQNEPKSECGWEELRWGYDRLRASLAADEDYDVILVLSAHWATHVGHHFIGLEHMEGLSVDPVFPNLFRYQYKIDFDVELAKEMSLEAQKLGLHTKMMTNPHFRPDYGGIVSCHMVNPKWDKPVVFVSSNQSYYNYTDDYGQDQAARLGKATQKAVEKLGRRAIVLASCSLSHRHFTKEPDVPEDMSKEHIYNYGNYLWDMRLLKMMREGRCQEAMDVLSDFNDQSVSECRSGSLTWMIHALGVPNYPAIIHAYGNVIGTGNAVVSFQPNLQKGAHQ